MSSSLFITVSLALRLAAAAVDAPHPFSVHDLLAMERISEPRVSPDGRRVVFTLRTTDLEGNAGRTDLWLVDVDGTGLRRLTSHSAADSNPCWTPDGQAVMFLSTRSGSSQVWRILLDGGEAVQVTDLPLDVGNLLLSPDGKLMAFSLDVFPDLPDARSTRQRLDEQSKRKSSGRIYDRAFVRHWDSWKDERRSHLFVMPTAGQGEPAGVMGRMDADAPSKPFGGTEEIAFTPDSQELVFTARDVGVNEPWSTDFDLYRVPVDGSRPAVCLTEKNDAWDCCPSFSRDGKTLAYLATARPGYESDRFRIVLRSWPQGEDRVLTETWDRSPSAVCWSADGQWLYTSAANIGHNSLFAVDAVSGKARIVVRNGDVQSPLIAGPRIVCLRSSLKSPAELYSVSPDGSDLREITQINAQRLAAVRWGDYEQFSFAGHANEPVFALIVKPADFDPAQVPRRLSDPRRSPGLLRRYVSLSLEPAGLRRGRLRRRDGRLPRFDRLRPGLYRFHPWRLGRKAARGSAAGASSNVGSLPVDGRRSCRGAGGLVRRLHDQLDCG